MKRNKGASRTEYAIILAIIIMCLVPVYLFFGQNIVNHLTAIFYNTKEINDNVNLNLLDNESRSIVTGSILAGDFNGTPDNPIKKCVKCNCF